MAARTTTYAHELPLQYVVVPPSWPADFCVLIVSFYRKGFERDGIPCLHSAFLARTCCFFLGPRVVPFLQELGWPCGVWQPASRMEGTPRLAHDKYYRKGYCYESTV